MISKSMNKNLSIKEHCNKLINKFKDSEKVSVNLFGLTVNNILKKERFYLKELDKESFENLNLLFENNQSNIYKGNMYSFLKNNLFIEDPINILIRNSTLSNIFVSDEDILIDNKLIKKEDLSEKTLVLDTSLFFVFFINSKTSNNFSRLILVEDKNIFLMKRKNKYFLFILDLI